MEHAKDTTPLLEALSKLKARSRDYIDAIERLDVAYSIVVDLVEVGGTENLDVLARKYSLPSDLLKAYLQLEKVERPDWLIDYVPESRTVRLKVNAQVVSEVLAKMGETVVPMPLPEGIRVAHSKLPKDYYETGDILVMPQDASRRRELGQVFEGFLRRFVNDALGRRWLLVEQYPDRGVQYVVRASFWEMVVLIHAGKREADDYQVREVYESVARQRNEEMFIEHFCPVVLAQGFTNRARDSAASLDPNFLLLPIHAFLRLVQYIEDLDDTSRQVALWSLFKLAEMPRTEGLCGVPAIRSFKKMVAEEIGRLQLTLSSSRNTGGSK